jgi:hypothetical protein
MPSEPTRQPEATADEGVWRIEDGEPAALTSATTYRADGVINLTYNNPYRLSIEKVWFDGKIVYAIESGEVELEFDEHRVARGNKVAQEYQIVYAVELDEHGKLKDGREPDRVPDQFNIYDSVPGMDIYSPLWQFNYVLVPRDYEANTIRSVADCLNSGYPIVKSTVVEN